MVCNSIVCIYDDIVLMAENEEELQVMLDRVGLYARKNRFTFNSEKSKVMVVGKKRNSGGRLLLNGKQLDSNVSCFKYLGVWFDGKLKGNIYAFRENGGKS